MDDSRERAQARLTVKIESLEEERSISLKALLDDELGDLARSNLAERLTRLTHYLTALKWVVGEVERL